LLELGVTGDVHLLQLERELGTDSVDHATRALAEVAPGSAVHPHRSRHRRTILNEIESVETLASDPSLVSTA
jgi:predicted metal-dependent HD superfamily phosphohydrolase